MRKKKIKFTVPVYSKMFEHKQIGDEQMKLVFKIVFCCIFCFSGFSQEFFSLPKWINIDQELYVIFIEGVSEASNTDYTLEKNWAFSALKNITYAYKINVLSTKYQPLSNRLISFGNGHIYTENARMLFRKPFLFKRHSSSFLYFICNKENTIFITYLDDITSSKIVTASVFDDIKNMQSEPIFEFSSNERYKFLDQGKGYIRNPKYEPQILSKKFSDGTVGYVFGQNYFIQFEFNELIQALQEPDSEIRNIRNKSALYKLIQNAPRFSFEGTTLERYDKSRTNCRYAVAIFQRKSRVGILYKGLGKHAKEIEQEGITCLQPLQTVPLDNSSRDPRQVDSKPNPCVDCNSMGIMSLEDGSLYLAYKYLGHIYLQKSNADCTQWMPPKAYQLTGKEIMSFDMTLFNQQIHIVAGCSDGTIYAGALDGTPWKPFVRSEEELAEPLEFTELTEPDPAPKYTATLYPVLIEPKMPIESTQK